VQYEQKARAEGNAKIQLNSDIPITIKFKITLSITEIKSYFRSVKKEVSYFISASCFEGACTQANQPINHSIFLTNDLLHSTTGGIITG
jgi:hypothetical protein